MQDLIYKYLTNLETQYYLLLSRNEEQMLYRAKILRAKIYDEVITIDQIYENLRKYIREFKELRELESKLEYISPDLVKQNIEEMDIVKNYPSDQKENVLDEICLNEDFFAKEYFI